MADRTPLSSPSEEKPAEPDTMKEQDTGAIGHPRETSLNAGQSGSFSSGADRTVYPPPGVYAPQAYYYRGYENAPGEWDDYTQYAEGPELGSPGMYNDNPLLFHTGYGYSPQMPYGPYSPVTTPLPSVGGDTPLYSPQQFPFSGPPYYQQMGPPNMPYPPASQELATLVSLEQQGDGMLFGPRPGYPNSLGSYGRSSNIPGSPGAIGFHEGFDGSRSGGLWTDWSKPSDRNRPPLSPALSPQPMGALGSFGQNIGMASQQQRSFYGFASGSDSYNRGYLQSGFHHNTSFGSPSLSSLGMSDRSWLALDNGRRRGRSSVASLCNCNGTLDILSEQNRGPRASKPKIQPDHSPSIDNDKHITSSVKTHDESYNRSDFVTEYDDARFFIIKSYSEDNVHKSIKYGVWASTPNGNKKLDGAYREAKEKQGNCPVFLLFSVNASAQFCGVAEMVGAVDFDKSVDYWQQDKWSGQFPVKWHIIKDVPNSQFRHIVLENNDNKPVTNSRDTQEVKLEQGIEILNIFKNYETEMSILDDFDFYEDRQKAMQERKARQQPSLGPGPVAVGLIGDSKTTVSVSLPTDFMKHMSKSFAQVVRLEDTNKEVAHPIPDRTAGSASDGSRVKLEDAKTTSTG